MQSAGTTPEPVYTAANTYNGNVVNVAEPMPYPLKARYRAGANRATRAIPGPIGELIARELTVVEEFGWSLGAQAFGTKLLKAVEALPVDNGQQSRCRGYMTPAHASETR